MSTRIRPAVHTDGPELFRLWSTLRSHESTIDSRITYRPVDQASFMADWTVALGRETSTAFVADEEGRIAAFVTASIVDGPVARLPEQHLNIGYLYVEPDFRRQGLGRRLFAQVSEWAQGQGGVEHVEMPVLAANAEAVAFWQSLGFQPFIERLWAPLPQGRDH